MDTHTPIAAVILAAGQGSRLGGRPKPALRIDGASLLERLASALRGSGVGTIGAVIGPYASTLLPLAGRCGVRALRHPHDAPTLVDSQRLALAAHARMHPAHDLLVVLGDLPLLDAGAVRALVRGWRARPPEVELMQPVVAGVRGHPVLMSSHCAASAHRLPPGCGIRKWMALHPGSVAPFHSDEPAYVTDLDTPEDVRALRRMLAPASVEWARAPR